MQRRFQVAGANSRALSVEQNAHWSRHFVREFANAGDDLAHPAPIRMTHVQSKNIRSLLDQLPEDFSLLCRRTKRTDDFCFSHRVKKWKKIAIIYASHLFDHRRAAIDPRNAIGSPR